MRPGKIRLMDNKRLKRQSGVALLITITVLFVITALVMTVNKNIRASLDKANLTMQRAKLRELATSGIQIGIAILMADKRTNDIDTIQEIWGDPQKIQEILADAGLTDGAVTLTITDELGKIQVNALVTYPDGKEFNQAQKSLWESFLKMSNPPDESLDTLGQNSEIIDCIKDWIDSNDDDVVTGINGAESDYYQGLDPPYKAANGPFRTIDELTLVKGIKPEMINRVEQGYCVKDLLTVYGMAELEKKPEDTEKKSLFTYPGDRKSVV
jgi:general secretion pathway protein K